LATLAPDHDGLRKKLALNTRVWFARSNAVELMAARRAPRNAWRYVGTGVHYCTVRLVTADMALSTPVVVYAVAPKYHVPLARLLSV